MRISMLALVALTLLAGCTRKAAPPTAAAKPAPPQATDTRVVIGTRFGDMTLMLYDATPLHRDNFLKLAREGYLNNTLFHRVIPNFMIQGGDPDSRTAQPGQALGNGGPAYTIPAEIVDSLYHRKGALAAARDNNPAKASSGSQFYIVQGRKWTAQELEGQGRRASRPLTEAQKQAYETIGGTPHLDGSYTVFGQLLSGFDVLDSIAAQPCGPNNRPIKDIAMTVKLVQMRRK